MFASDYYSITPRMVTEITDLALLMRATVHFVHVENNDPVVPKQERKDVFDALLLLLEPELSYEIHAVYGPEPMEALKKYADKHNINIMAFVSKHRTFWERLMHHGITENMVLNTNTPMLLIHTDDATN
jgi:nucleotide-binding universal stress UspA family protein